MEIVICQSLWAVNIGEYQDVQKTIDIFSCFVNFESHHLHDEMMNIAIKIATLDNFQDLKFQVPHSNLCTTVALIKNLTLA